VPGVTVALENSGGDNVLKIVDFDIMGIQIEMNEVIITPFGDGYKLSRATPISFEIPEITIPPVPPLFPGGTFNDVPVSITLENTKIVNFVMNLELKIVATIIYVIPIPITFNINFEGSHTSPPAPPVIITTILQSGKVDEEYLATLEAEGDIPITWSIESGELPTNLTLNAETGVISGTPTEAGIFDFIIMASNTSGNDTRPLSIEIEDVDTTGIKIITNDELRITVYPNPTTGEFRVSSSEFRVEGIEICDVYGKNVGAKFPSNLLEGWQPKADGVVLDIQHLPEGLYFIKIQTEKGITTKKLLKH
jgi:hypothetical protein